MSQTKIIIQQFALDAYVGIYPDDKIKTNPILVDVECIMSFPQVAGDSIEHTLNYEGLVIELRRMAGIHYNLIEKFAADFCDFCLLKDKITAVTVTIQKPKMFPEGHVGVRVSKSR
jgi:7,8-dihydroneopterin aldolase/epimerase/oxygenase